MCDAFKRVNKKRSSKLQGQVIHGIEMQKLLEMVVGTWTSVQVSVVLNSCVVPVQYYSWGRHGSTFFTITDVRS